MKRPASQLFRALGHLQRGYRAASQLVSLRLPASASAGPSFGLPDRVTEVADFGSNPGRLRMLIFRPPEVLRAGAPLIIVLHGCHQDATGFATDAGWLALARRLRLPLVLPEQSAGNNRGRCFNWFRPGDTGRDSGEALSIRQMVRVAVKRFGSDRRRVFVVGLSAGGAMTAALLAAYPAVFAAGAVVAGMPVGVASNPAMALLRMRRADRHRSRDSLAAVVAAAAPPRQARRSWPRLSIWQGGRDRTVDPDNAELLAAQWSALHGLAAIPASDAAPLPGARRRCWGTAKKPAVELWTLAEMGHGFPVAAGEAGEGPGPWVLSAGVSAVQAIADFWQLDRGGAAG